MEVAYFHLLLSDTISLSLLFLKKKKINPVYNQSRKAIINKTSRDNLYSQKVQLEESTHIYNISSTTHI